MIQVSAAGGATTADFRQKSGNLAYSPATGRLTYTGTPFRQSATLVGNSQNLVTSLQISAAGLHSGDYIVVSLAARAPCLTVAKISEGQTGSFQFNMVNVVAENGSAVPSTTLTTTEPGVQVTSPQYFSADTRTNLLLAEVVPEGWNAASAVCTDRNAGTTGNPSVIGEFNPPGMTIPADNVRPEADIQCLFTNEQSAEVDLSITKDNGGRTYVPGSDTTYTIVVANAGPDDAMGALVTDTLPPFIISGSTVWTCGSETGGGVCSASSGTGNIRDIPVDLPAGASVTFQLSVGIPLTFSGPFTNVATVTPPSGTTDIDMGNNTATDTDTMDNTPPVFGQCAPRYVGGSGSFDAGPLPVTASWTSVGTMEWRGVNWATQGGNFAWEVTFSEPVPAEWLQFGIHDVNAPAPYNPVFTITTTGPSATPADFSPAGGEMTYNPATGVVSRRDVGGGAGVRERIYLAGNSQDLVRTLRITATDIPVTDFIAVDLLLRPACVTLEKTSEEQTGSFEFQFSTCSTSGATQPPARP